MHWIQNLPGFKICRFFVLFCFVVVTHWPILPLSYSSVGNWIFGILAWKEMSLIYYIENSTCPGQFSTYPAKNALALAIGWALVSLTGTRSLHRLGQSYTRSVPWLLMPWWLTSPGHQQPWYWLYMTASVPVKQPWSIWANLSDESLTHWGWVMHICVSKLAIISSSNDFSPGRCQAIIWNNTGILLIEPLRTNFSEISIKIYTFSFKKMHLKMSSGKWRPFCLGLNVLRNDCIIISKQNMAQSCACFVKYTIYSILEDLILSLSGMPCCVTYNYDDFHGKMTFICHGKMTLICHM